MIKIERSGRTAVIDLEGGILTAVLDAQGNDLLALGNPRDSKLIARGDLVGTGLRGWIDCFPTIAPEQATSLSGPMHLSGHGELWRRPWDVVELGEDFATLSCELHELGLRYVRRVEVSNGRIAIRSTVINLGASTFTFIWASHPLFATSPDSWIELPDSKVTQWPATVGSSSLNAEWPGDNNRRRWADFPKGRAVKLFMPWPEDGVLFSIDGSTKRRMTFSITGAVGTGSPRLGLWLNREGYPADRPLNHFAIEPTVGSADSLSFSAEEGTAGALAAGASVTLEVSVIDELRSGEASQQAAIHDDGAPGYS